MDGGPRQRIPAALWAGGFSFSPEAVWAMPRDFLADAKRRLGEAYALLDARIDDLKVSDPQGALRDRLIVARECVRDALTKVEHAEEAITAGDDQAGSRQSTPPVP